MNINSILLPAILLTTGVASALETKPTPPPRKVTAAQFIEDAKHALALIGRTTQECTDKSLDPKTIRQQPFWSALKETEEEVVLLESRLKKHDVSFFEALNASTQSTAELRGSLPRSGIKNAKIESGVRALSTALSLLRKNYGVEGLRRKQGGELSDKERTDFAKLKENEKVLVKDLQGLLNEVKSNAHLTAEVTRLIAQLTKSIDAPMTVDDYSTALELIDVVDGEWESYSFYVDPKNRKAWNSSHVTEALKIVDATNRESTKDVNVPDWSYLDAPIEYTPATTEPEIDIAFEANEIDGYIAYIAKNTAEVELDFYYAEAPTDDLIDQPIKELNDD